MRTSVPSRRPKEQEDKYRDAGRAGSLGTERGSARTEYISHQPEQDSRRSSTQDISFKLSSTGRSTK